MTSFVALLRGINVSGQNSIRMAALQESCLALGFTGVHTYLQSGNVVFSAAKTDESKLATAMQKRITQDFGHDIPVLVMPAKMLAEIADSNPLWPQSGGDEKLFHATFLFRPVSPDSFHRLKLPAVAGERAVLMGNTVLLHCPHGYGKTKLNNSYYERALNVSATTRNWRTVLALKALCGTG